MSGGKNGNGAAAAPVVPCTACPLRKLTSFRAFSAEELDFVQSFKMGELVVDAGGPIFLEGSDSPHIYTVLDGWALRYRMLESGRRQVLNFALPGDLIGLQGALFGKMLHSVDAMTPVRLCVFSRQRLWELYQKHSGLAFDLTWIASREESILAEHLTYVGQRSALERLAYIIAYVMERCRKLGMVRNDTLATPITQQDLGDAMGLSIVHTNKSLRRLAATGAIEWKRGEIVVRNARELARLATYEPHETQSRPFI
ncbi:MAG TPA: Crp/Fnr family transcriptional regulator [Rhodoblastus sp.]|nr:Crp/Fnr family transcriptional regulator [Rhodoblastus sp.]